MFYDRSKPLASLSDENAVLNPGRMGREFAAGTAVGGILGAGQLAGSKLTAADPMELAGQGDYSGYVRELQEIIEQKRLDEFMAEYEKHMRDNVSPKRTEPNSTKVQEFKDQTEYSAWLTSIGAQGSELGTLEKYTAAKYNNSQEYQLLSGYGKAVGKGDISPLVGFEEYGQTNQLIQESVVGTLTATGVEIESFATHFIDRVIGQTSTAHSNMRCGVSVEDVVDALENPTKVGPIRTMEDGDVRQTFYGTKVTATISIRDKRLIQTNPRGR